MKNRKMLLIVSLVLAMTMSLGGTLAYLTDTDADVNVMTLGNVQIEQHEYERVVDDDGNYETTTVTKANGDSEESYKLQEFTQNKPLLPAVGNPNDGYTDTYARFEQLDSHKTVQGGQQFLKGIKNAQDKIVLVENTGVSPAYVRTFFAFEMGSKTVDEWDALVMPCFASESEPWDKTWLSEAVTINGNNYRVVEAVYAGYSTGNERHKGGILPGGDWTYNSLAEIYLVPEATNEDLEALDGNKNCTYDILVLSQAVQADGFEKDDTTGKSAAQVALEAGFGEANTTNVKAWFEGNEEISGEVPEVSIVNVSTADELVNAFANIKAGDKIVLNADIDMTGKTLDATNGNVGFTLQGRGYTISNLSGTEGGLFVNNTGSADYYFYDVNLKNCQVNSSSNYAGLFVGDADTCDELVIEGCTVTDCTVQSNKYAAAFVAYTAGWNVVNDGPVYSDVTIKNCKMIGGSITGGGSTAVAVAHAGGNVDTTTTITDLTVRNVVINGEDAEHTGIVVGTANVGKTIINNVTYSGVTCNYNTTTNLYGRSVPGDTGKLIIDGVEK